MQIIAKKYPNRFSLGIGFEHGGTSFANIVLSIFFIVFGKGMLTLQIFAASVLFLTILYNIYKFLYFLKPNDVITQDGEFLLFHKSKKITIIIRITDIIEIKSNQNRRNSKYNFGTLSIKTKTKTYDITWVDKIGEVESLIKTLIAHNQSNASSTK